MYKKLSFHRGLSRPPPDFPDAMMHAEEKGSATRQLRPICKLVGDGFLGLDVNQERDRIQQRRLVYNSYMLYNCYSG
jgi:hypothetical protein